MKIVSTYMRPSFIKVRQRSNIGLHCQHWSTGGFNLARLMNYKSEKLHKHFMFMMFCQIIFHSIRIFSNKLGLGKTWTYRYS